MLYMMVTFTINIPQMLAYIPHMDPMVFDGRSAIVSMFTDKLWHAQLRRIMVHGQWSMNISTPAWWFGT